MTSNIPFEMENNIYQIHRSPSLENQIEVMLDKVMDGDNEDENLRFSDDENSFEKFDKDHITYFNEGSSFFNSNILHGSTTSEEPELSFQRGTKKFSTVNPSNFYPPQSTFVPYNPTPSLQYNLNPMLFQVHPLQFALPPQQNFSFRRSDNRKKTYDINKDQLNIQNSNLYYNSNNSINTSMTSLNSTSGFSNQKGNIGYSPCERRSRAQMSAFAQVDKEKRFSTMMFPKGTNMQIEMLLYELSNASAKTEKIDYFIYNKLQGNFVNVIKTHKGSRIFQNYLKNTHSDIIHQIFIEISPSLPDIISDSYANYFSKRFFTYLNQKDKVDFLLAIQSSLVSLSMDNIGTYPIQSIIEQVGSKIEKKIIIKALQGSISELCYNTYGTHVLEKIICCFEEEFTSFIYDYVTSNFISLANNINGICLVKKTLTLTYKKELHEKLKKLSYDNAYNLIQHSFGNYVIQVIVENWDEREIIEVTSQFDGKYVGLSMQKYSSNVVERCIEKSEIILAKYITEICESDRIAEVMKNNFGNYVIQKGLKISKGKERVLLVDTVNKNIFRLNDKKLISKWKSIVHPYNDNNELNVTE